MKEWAGEAIRYNKVATRIVNTQGLLCWNKAEHKSLKEWEIKNGGKGAKVVTSTIIGDSRYTAKSAVVSRKSLQVQLFPSYKVPSPFSICKLTSRKNQYKWILSTCYHFYPFSFKFSFLFQSAIEDDTILWFVCIASKFLSYLSIIYSSRLPSSQPCISSYISSYIDTRQVTREH